MQLLFWKEKVWRRSFKYAVKVLAFSALWIVVGIVIAFVGILLVAAAIRPGGAGGGVIVAGFILFMLGYVVLYLGFLTALFRYLPQALADEVGERRR